MYKITNKSLVTNYYTYMYSCTRFMSPINTFLFQRREDGRSSTYWPSENSNNNVLKNSRSGILRNPSLMSSTASIKSYGGNRKGSKRAVSVIHNASFRQDIGDFIIYFSPST